MEATAALTSDETSFSLVCEENLGSCTLTDTTAVSPSRVSSPEMESLSLAKVLSFVI